MRYISWFDLGWYHTSIMINEKRTNATSSRYPFYETYILHTYSIFLLYIFYSIFNPVAFSFVYTIMRFKYICPEENYFCFDDLLPIKQQHTYDDVCATMINLIVEIVRHHHRWLLNVFSETNSSKFKIIRKISF